MASPEGTRAHVQTVASRVATAAPDDLRDLALLVAAVHEERDPGRLRAAARAAGAGGLTDDVVAVALAFGEVWTLADEGAVDDYVARHADRLRALLLFELAHEGAATDRMAAAAARAGLAEELEAWEGRLR